MLRETTKFMCGACGYVFEILDIEDGAMAGTMPMRCPNCCAACLPQKGGWLQRLLGILKSTNMFETELTAAQQQVIMQRTGWSMAVVGCIRTMDEARIYMNAGLMEARIGGRPALIRRDIDWSAFNCRQEWLKQKFADWDKWQDYNNADLIGEGWPPRDSNGDPYELHHIGQRQDSPFAELTWQEHMGDGNNAILHPNRESVIDRQQFDGEKSRYWQDRFKAFTKEEIKRIYG